MPSLRVYVALYDYQANTEDELTIKENDVLYILEDDNPDWWKARLKTADPNDLHVGLVPSNYVEPLPSIGTVLGLYRYEAATEEELTIEEGDTLALYKQDDPDWFLVGNGSHVGFVPRNYVEVSPGQKDSSWEHQAGGDQREEPTPSTVRAHGNKDDIKLWAVKSPVRQWLIKDAVNVRHEKSHVYLDLSGASPTSLDFKAASKQEAVAIFYKIQKSRITHHVASPLNPRISESG
ncbi:cytoskeletal protein binding protein [Mortierella sp. NVP85]|nr:cytoskeletal protein binding protein [Mortierella sp. NVP85]